MDGFDTYSNANDLDIAYFSAGYSAVNQIGFGTTLGRFGQGAIVFSAQNLFAKTFNSPLTSIWMGHAFNLQAQANTTSLLYNFVSALGYESQITFNAVTGQWALMPGAQSPGTPIITGNYSITTNTWHWLETQYTIGNATTGTSQFWVDGIQVWNVSNVDTSVTGSTTFYTIIFGSGINDYFSLAGYMDDLYILDTTDDGFNTTRLGDCRIETLIPTSDAGPNDGTPLVSGPNYEMVNASQNNNGNTYVQLNGVPSQEEVYTTTSLSSIPEFIYGIRVVNVVEKTDGGIIYGNAVIRSGGVTVYGNPQQVLSDYSLTYGIFETDPNTSGNAWVYATANAADVGYTITT